MVDGVVKCPVELAEVVRWMLHELEERRLEVGLIPAPEKQHVGHCIRVAIESNPEWYRELCALFPRSRNRKRKDKFTDPRFIRADIRRVLAKLLDGGSRSQFAPVLVELARDEQQRWAEYARAQGMN